MASFLRLVLSKVLGEDFYGRGLPLRLVFKTGIVQKILGFNRSVPWPVHRSSKILCPSKIDRGTRYPGLSMGCHIDGRNGIKFGKNVWIGPRVSVISMNHDPNDYHRYVKCDPVVIGDHCWLGANSIILPGVELGKHTVVAAGSVVTKSFKGSNQVLAGVPAQIVKELAKYEGRV